MTTSFPTPDEPLAFIPDEMQYAVVHTSIQAIAEHCDGAVERDKMGFDGTDTKYGRRIAAVPFEVLTDDDKLEEARIILKYRKQVLAWTGNDVAVLPVVLAAQDNGTNYVSRQNARMYERQARTAHLKDERKATVLANGKIALAWVKGDPDFSALLTAVKALPGRSFNWDTKANEVPPSAAVLAFLDEWDIEAPEAVLRAVETQQAAEAARVHVTLMADGRIAISADYDAGRVAEARDLPGRRWNGVAKQDECDAHPAVLTFATKWGLKVSPEAAEMCNRQKINLTVQEGRKALLLAASTAGSPEELPEGFESLF